MMMYRQDHDAWPPASRALAEATGALNQCSTRLHFGLGASLELGFWNLELSPRLSPGLGSALSPVAQSCLAPIVRIRRPSEVASERLMTFAQNETGAKARRIKWQL